ncbi:MAG: TIGR02452 family protein, partial [Lachnospiraceae bacterium]
MYNESREERIEIFQDTKRIYETDRTLADAVKESQKNQVFLAETDAVPTVVTQKYDIPAKVIVSKKRTLEAAVGYR